MPSSFVQHHIRPLSSRSSRSIPLSSQGTPSIQSLFISLQDPSSQTLTTLTNAASALRSHTDERVARTSKEPPSEDSQLQSAILSRIVVGAYGHALDLHLSEASRLEEEAEWWADVERSLQNSAYYFLQTLPGRIAGLIRDCTEQLRAHNQPIRLSSYSPNALRHLFASTGAQLSSFVLNSIFPHTKNSRLSTQFLLLPATRNSDSWLQRFNSLAQRTYSAFLFPILLAQQECRVKRSQLEQLRDQRAEILGALIQLRQPLHETLEKNAGPSHLIGFIDVLDKVTDLDSSPSSGSPPSTNAAVRLDDFLQHTYPDHKKRNEHALQQRQLIRPSYWIRVWPRLLLLPPTLLYAISALYSSRASILNAAQDTGATVQAFFQSWVLEPLKEIVHTVRADRTEGVLIQKEGIEADLASLERMILSLAKDTLKWGPEQLHGLSKQVRAGDLTPVLEIYEDDIKSPIRSVITGNLLRSAFIQVQKAKVDIDQALAGIDKLLKSQELTFAFVGVAPALGVVYVLGGYIRSLLFNRSDRSRYGSKAQRSAAWSAIRRVERLLLTQPLNVGAQARVNVQQLLRTANADTDIPPLTSGLLMLSVSRLRSYGEKSLPLGSRVRDGFIEDVGDLEDPRLDKSSKLHVVHRIWRTWGDVLGWNDLIQS